MKDIYAIRDKGNSFSTLWMRPTEDRSELDGEVERLKTGKYKDKSDGLSYDFMKYTIPANASPRLRRYMEAVDVKLKRATRRAKEVNSSSVPERDFELCYEHGTRKRSADDASLHSSIKPEDRKDIIQLPLIQ